MDGFSIFWIVSTILLVLQDFFHPLVCANPTVLLPESLVDVSPFCSRWASQQAIRKRSSWEKAKASIPWSCSCHRWAGRRMLDAAVFQFFCWDTAKRGSTTFINIYMPHMFIPIYVYTDASIYKYMCVFEISKVPDCLEMCTRPIMLSTYFLYLEGCDPGQTHGAGGGWRIWRIWSPWNLWFLRILIGKHVDLTNASQQR